MSKDTGTERGRDAKSNTRRDLVRIENVKSDTARPTHLFSVASGELIAKLKPGADIDLFLSQLSPEAFE